MKSLAVFHQDQFIKTFIVADNNPVLKILFSKQYGFFKPDFLKRKDFESNDLLQEVELTVGKNTQLKLGAKEFSFQWEDVQLPNSPYFLAEETSKKDRFGTIAAVIGLMFLLFIVVMDMNQVKEGEEIPKEVAAQEVVQPINIQIKTIVPEQMVMQTTVPQKTNKTLGFIGVLGRQDLRKALGGLPTVVGASAGAGTGGNEGSGGQSLANFGEGLKNVSIGNGNVQGLGGIGTKGKGGGAGGYGTVELSGGGGTGLSFRNISKEVVLEGGLSKDIIAATIERYLSQIRYCYEQGLRNTPGLQGRVLSDFVINGQGGVKLSRIASTTLNHRQVESCIEQKILGWKFPLPKGGVETKVKYPFILHPTKG